MKGRQLAMDSLLKEADRDEQERKRREWAREEEQTNRIIAELDDKHGRMDYFKLRDCGYPAGSVVIIGQKLFRNDHYTWHFYRTVLIYWDNLSGTYPRRPYFVQANNEEWQDLPPWADTVGHEGELKDMNWYPEHIHWATGEIVKPIRTWWMEKWGGQEYEHY